MVTAAAMKYGKAGGIRRALAGICSHNCSYKTKRACGRWTLVCYEEASCKRLRCAGRLEDELEVASAMAAAR